MLRWLAFAVMVGGAAWVILPPEDSPRRPTTTANPAARPPLEVRVGNVPHVTTIEAAELLLPDSLPPAEPARLLWFEGRPARPLAGGGVVTLDGSGGVLVFDARLRARRRGVESEARAIVSVAAGPAGGLWLADDGGELVRVDRDGRRVGEAVRIFDYASVAADAEGRAVWVVRSAERFSYRFYPDGPPPALVALDSAGRVADSLGRAVMPGHALLADLANAGHIALAGDTVFFAPFIRDEVIAFGPRGDTLWVASRGLAHSRPEPRFELSEGRVVIDYAPVNLGIATGPDGLVYVLSTVGTAMDTSRLDVIEPFSGRVIRTARLDGPRPTPAVGISGRVYSLDPFRLLTGVAPRERESFRPFDLELLGGARMTLDDLHGKVTLVNFWASWCAPCRAEMPALDTLRRVITDPAFTFVTINEDVRPDAAAGFIREFGFDFPVLLGLGQMKARYRYVGLPFTVLLDREGRVVHRWLGFAGREQLAAIRALALAELARAATPSRTPHAAH